MEDLSSVLILCMNFESRIIKFQGTGETNLWYVFSLNLTSGQSHASENVTVRTEPEGIVTDATMAAPIDDPGSEGEISLWPRWSNDPCYKIKGNKINIFVEKEQHAK